MCPSGVTCLPVQLLSYAIVGFLEKILNPYLFTLLGFDSTTCIIGLNNKKHSKID
jgi:hypothetical protein